MDAKCLSLSVYFNLIQFIIIIDNAHSCSAPYESKADVCYKILEEEYNITDAVEACATINGKVISPKQADILHHNSVTIPLYIYVDVIDWLHNVGTNKTGWTYFDGTPFIDTVMWHSKQPKEASAYCVYYNYFYKKLFDSDCIDKLNVICTPEIESPVKKLYTQQVSPHFTAETNSKCFLNFDNISVMDCALKCGENSKICRGYYYSVKLNKCLVNIYIASGLDKNKYSSSDGWIRYEILK